MSPEHPPAAVLTPRLSFDELWSLVLDFEAGLLPPERWTVGVQTAVTAWYLWRLPDEIARERLALGLARLGRRAARREVPLTPIPTAEQLLATVARRWLRPTAAEQAEIQRLRQLLAAR